VTRSLGKDPVAVSVALAREYGVPEAFLLQQIYYWCSSSKATIHLGERWVERSARDWADELPFSAPTIERIVKSLVDKGLVVIHVRHGKSNLYRLAYGNLKTALLSELAVANIPQYDGPLVDANVHQDDGPTSINLTEHLHQSDGPTSIKLMDPLYKEEKNTENIEKQTEMETEATPLSPEDKHMKIIKNGEKGKKTPDKPVKKSTTSAAILAGLHSAKPTKPTPKNSKESAIEIWRAQNQYFELQQTVPVLTTIEKSKLASCVGRWGPTSDDYLTILLKRWVAFGQFVRDNKWPNFKTPSRPSITFIHSNLNDATEFCARELTASQVQPVAPSSTQKAGSAKLPLPATASPQVHLVTGDLKPATLEEIEAINKELGLE
jgi:hypothetical protein